MGRPIWLALAVGLVVGPACATGAGNSSSDTAATRPPVVSETQGTTTRRSSQLPVSAQLLQKDDVPEGWEGGAPVAFHRPGDGLRCPAPNPLKAEAPITYDEAKLHHGSTTLVHAVGRYESSDAASTVIRQFAEAQGACLGAPYPVPGGQQETDVFRVALPSVEVGEEILPYRSRISGSARDGFESLLVVARRDALVSVIWLAGTDAADLALIDGLVATAWQRL